MERNGLLKTYQRTKRGASGELTLVYIGGKEATRNVKGLVGQIVPKKLVYSLQRVIFFQLTIARRQFSMVFVYADVMKKQAQ